MAQALLPFCLGAPRLAAVNEPRVGDCMLIACACASRWQGETPRLPVHLADNAPLPACVKYVCIDGDVSDKRFSGVSTDLPPAAHVGSERVQDSGVEPVKQSR